MPTKRAKRPAAKTAPPRTVNDYLAAAPREQQAALKQLRAIIRAAAPKATESVSYGIVGYKLDGKRLVYFGYWKAHIALYGVSGTVIKTHAKALAPYAQSKGTIQFPSDRPLPERLIATIVKDRATEVARTA